MRWIVYSLFIVLFLNGLLSVFTREAKIGFRQNYVMHLTGVLAIAAGIIQMIFSAKMLLIIYNGNIH